MTQLTVLSEAEVYIFRGRGVFIDVYETGDKIATSSSTSLADTDLRRTYRAIDSVANGRIPSLFCAVIAPFNKKVISTLGAGTGNVEIIIIDPHGQKDTTKPRIARSTETTYYVEYLPKDVGRYVIHIFFASKEIPTSPYPVNVSAGKCHSVIVFVSHRPPS